MYQKLKISLLIGLMSTALLAVDYSGGGQLELNNGLGNMFNAKQNVQGTLRYKWKLWSLMEEPVDKLIAKWTLRSVEFSGESEEMREKLQDPVTGSFTFYPCVETRKNSSCIPNDVMEKSSIIKLKLRGYSGNIGNAYQSKSYSYIFDAGILARPFLEISGFYDGRGTGNKWSYNTPGSKSWDKCFEGKTENESKNIMKTGVDFKSFSIEEIEFDFTEVKRYIIERNKEYENTKNVDRYQNIVRESDNPFDVLEKLDKDKKSNNGKDWDSNRDIDSEYASVEKQLDNEAQKKKNVIEVVRNRINARFLPTNTQTIHHNGYTYGTVKSPHTNKIWLDRNIGASRVCKSLDDEACYGDLLQWSGNNWSKIDGSSVCPKGFRVPDIRELEYETLKAGGVSNNKDAFNSFLKIPSAGSRKRNGSLSSQSSSGYLWSSSDNYTGKLCLLFLGSKAFRNTNKRDFGFSVRCLKD